MLTYTESTIHNSPYTNFVKIPYTKNHNHNFWEVIIVLSGSITSIGAGSFSGCSSLSQITIPSSIEKIGEGAFRFCLSLDNVVLPEKLVDPFFDKMGFYSCTVSAFMQYVLAELINNGDFERHINRVRRARRKGEL